MPFLHIAFLQNVGPGTIALMGMVPALLFTVYVIWDDHRQAKAHHGAGHDHH
jgi:hypothetical protein